MRKLIYFSEISMVLTIRILYLALQEFIEYDRMRKICVVIFEAERNRWFLRIVKFCCF